MEEPLKHKITDKPVETTLPPTQPEPRPSEEKIRVTRQG